MSTDLSTPAQAISKAYELPFYLVCTLRENWRLFNHTLNAEYDRLVRLERTNQLQKEHPEDRRPLASMYVNKAMIEDSLWAVTDAEGLRSEEHTSELQS